MLILQRNAVVLYGGQESQVMRMKKFKPTRSNIALITIAVLLMLSRCGSISSTSSRNESASSRRWR